MTKADIKIFNLNKYRINDYNGNDDKKTESCDKILPVYNEEVIDSTIEKMYGDPKIELRIYNPDNF